MTDRVISEGKMSGCVQKWQIFDDPYTKKNDIYEEGLVKTEMILTTDYRVELAGLNLTTDNKKNALRVEVQTLEK